MTLRQTTGRAAVGILLLVALTLGAAAAMTSAQDRDAPATGTADQQPIQVTPDGEASSTDAARDEADGLRVGTYNPQMAFTRYHGMEAYNEFLASLEEEAMQAQQSGDQQKLIELQQRVQRRQNEIVEAFEAELDEALPRVAKDAGVRLIVVDVAFKDDTIRETDLTQQIIELVNADVARDDENGGDENADTEKTEDAPSPQNQP